MLSSTNWKKIINRDNGTCLNFKGVVRRWGGDFNCGEVTFIAESKYEVEV